MNIPIRTVLADDHRVFCDGIAELLTQSSSFVILKKIHVGPQVLEELPHLDADLLLLDIEIPGMSGLDILKRIRLINENTKVVMLSMHDETVYAKRAYQSGADGYFAKSIDGSALVESLLRIVDGKKQFSADIIRQPVNQGILSNQEIKVLRMLRDGNTSAEISYKLGISILTVKTHRQNMMRKLNAENSAGLISNAFSLGIL